MSRARFNQLEQTQTRRLGDRVAVVGEQAAATLAQRKGGQHLGVEPRAVADGRQTRRGVAQHLADGRDRGRLVHSPNSASSSAWCSLSKGTITASRSPCITRSSWYSVRLIR